MLFRLFPYQPGASARDEGGPLHVPRPLQGRGRHDAPDVYGALYASRSAVSVVAEFLQRFQRQTLEATDLWWERDRPYALASLDDARLPPLVDLDDPSVLVARGVRPSSVATRTRKVTQRWARSLHAEGEAGFEWWSTIEASWINVTLFEERAASKLSLTEDPEPVTLEHAAVRGAAELLGIRLAA